RSGAFELGQVGTHLYLEMDTPATPETPETRETSETREIGEIDLRRLGAALNRLIERHDMLRAVVLPDGRQQILERVPPYAIAVLELGGREPAQAERELQAVRRRMSHQVLPADRWPLFEVRASRLPGGGTRFHVSFDFLIGDAWSCQILLRELSALYSDPGAS